MSQKGRSCFLLRRGRRWREEQVLGDRSRAQRLCSGDSTETVRHLLGDADLLVGYKTST